MSEVLRHTRAELLKITTGRALLGTLIGGVLWSALTGYGYYTQGIENLAAMTPGEISADVVRAWMMMLLFSAITCALIVTRDVSDGTLSRSVLSYGGKSPVFLAKLLAALCVSTLFALTAVAGAAANYALVAGSSDTALPWGQENTKILLGVFACVVLAGAWGLMAGWLVRNQTLAVLAIVVLVVGIEPAVQSFLPKAAQFLFTIALSSIYRDPKPDLLSIGAAFAVALLWVAILALAARVALRRRDVG